ncbi:E-selectin-like [Halichondria panicea]|uniref:E-selectin-like n=1 Tax=Halichondria panicea TaxID=6063 RepID=UPI00312B5B87
MAVDEYEYYGISYDILSSSFPSVILFVACENETVVKFDSLTITLDSMETYQMESVNDITGTRITSSKPLSVFSGSECANVPQGIGACDHLVEQVPPTVTWGLKFLVASLEGRYSGERIRVLSARATSVAVNCNTDILVSEFQLQSGGSFREFELPISSFCSIESTSPVLVAQYAYGGESDGVGDPFMMIIPPIEQFTNNYLVESFTIFTSNYVTICLNGFVASLSETDEIVCTIITCPPSTTPSNGSVTYSAIANQNDTYAFDVVATYNCFAGFSIVGDNTRNCTGDGSSTTGAFAGIAPICAAITCPPLSNPTNGSVSYSNVPGQGNSYDFNVEATYSCDIGYSLVDNNTRTCTGDGSSTTGSFDGESPTCEVITCPRLSDPSNGTVTYNVESGNFEFGTQAIYSCDNGFSLVGNTTRTCTGDGSSTTSSFDGEAPTCEAIMCPALSDPINGEIDYDGGGISANNNQFQIPFGTMATYTCVIGFDPIGNDIRTCTGDGSSTTGAFSGIDPTCEPITCPPLMTPTNGTVSYSGVPTDVNGNLSFNVIATYSCDTGFALVDNRSRICTGDGMSVNCGFNGTAPTCDPITCPALAAPSSSSIDFGGASSDGNSNYAFDVVANYNCDIMDFLWLVIARERVLEMTVALLVLLMEQLQLVNQ